jgi:sugar lactone lactonase YvrE
MPQSRRIRFGGPVAVVVLIAAAVGTDVAQTNDAPNPYRAEAGWAQMPAGRTWGSTSAVGIDKQGNIWVGERCGANTCAGSSLPPLLQFDRSGRLLKSFGAGTLIFPHGFDVDPEGNIWVTDAQGKDGRGHQVLKFSPDGALLLALGKAGVPGDGPDTFNQPSDVVVAASGDIFVADGHDSSSNARIVKFAKDGRFIKTWGKRGSAPGEFDTPHTIAIDSRGRVFVGDRANNRIQIFDQEGNFIEAWKQFGRPSGIDIDVKDTIYVTDSESNTKRNPGWKRGIRIGSARDGKFVAFIPDPEPQPDASATSGAEGVAVDADGTVYGAEVGPKGVRRYTRK